MIEPVENTKLKERVKASLEESARNLDADTQQRLNAIRRAALNQPAKANWFKANWLKFNGWIPATVLVFCSVIAMLFILPSHQTPNQATDLVEQTAMLELLDNPDALDAMSDPDFYIWIDEVESANDDQHAA